MRLRDDVLALLWDGGDFGECHNVRECVFLACGRGGCAGRGRLRPVALFEPDEEISGPQRMGISLLLDAGEDPSEFFGEDQCRFALSRLKSEAEGKELSSMEGLFDGAAAILGIKGGVFSKGQGAELLDAALIENNTKYLYSITESGGTAEVDLRRAIKTMVFELKAGIVPGITACRLMNTCIALAADICERMRAKTGFERVVLSGGSFKSGYLFKNLSKVLEEKGFAVLSGEVFASQADR